ncbi:MAG: hypothetical protein RLZZ324_793 [Candidatus Parcubacteria bacterium]|jgi:glycosyltransferase involved in cell wall biosynthesis
MKIMMVNNLYGALARGGAEKVVEAEALALVAAGHAVTVVSLDPDAPEAGDESSGFGGIREIRYAPNARATKRFLLPGHFSYLDLARHGWFARLLWHVHDMCNVVSARSLRRIIEREKPDVVHTHNLMGLGFMIPRMLRRIGVRHVHTVHDVQLLDPSGLLIATPRPDVELAPHQAAYAWLMRALMGSPQAVCFPSAFHKGIHLARGFFPKSRHAVLRNPAPYAPRGGILGRGERDKVFLFAGQLEEHKGASDLLDAWIHAHIEDARLEIVGSGILLAVLQQRASELTDVHMPGRLSGIALSEAYDRASWIVVPSRVIENAPSALMEALSRGVPAIAARSGGIPELVRDGENGILFAPGDVDALAAALKRADAMDPEMHGQYSSTASGAMAGLDAAAHAERLVRLYEGRD